MFWFFSGVKYLHFNEKKIWLNDYLELNDILYIASSKSALLKESNKSRAKKIMQKSNITTAEFFTTGVAQQRCISLECGLQNGTLAVFVATQLFDEMVYIVPTAAYALVMMATSLFFVYVVKKNS